MLIQIGISGVARELSFDVDMKEDELFDKVRNAVDNNQPLDLTDSKKRRVIIPSGKLGYVLLAESKRGPVGFTVA